MTANELPGEARAELDPLDPDAAVAETTAGAALVDIRSDSERERDGLIPGAMSLDATDVVGGFQAWRAAGRPVEVESP
jgi:rhodanese-related sulfurtransferase